LISFASLDSLDEVLLTRDGSWLGRAEFQGSWQTPR
jgi:hypothetical protein